MGAGPYAVRFVEAGCLEFGGLTRGGTDGAIFGSPGHREQSFRATARDCSYGGGYSSAHGAEVPVLRVRGLRYPLHG